MTFTQPVSTLGERFELGSEAWVDEARRYLGEQAASLNDVTYSLGSLWTDPPPHLGFDGEPGGWSATFVKGEVTVQWGPPNPDQLDLCAVGDYNAAIPIATTIYGDDPSVRDRAERESRHRARDGHLQMTGTMPGTALGQVLHGLHDHLARRTIDNVDIEHRIHHLGLDRHAAELAENGYTIIEHAVTEAFADDMAAEIHRVHDENPDAPGFRANMLLRRGRLFEEAAQHPFVLALVERLIGRGCLMFQSNCIRKEPGQETHQLHADYLSIPEPFPAYPLEVTSIWALEDWTPEAGPTVFVPGSFREKRRPRGNEVEAAVPLLMPKGSIALWDGATWHAATPRTKEGRRVSLHNAYCRMELRPVEHYLEIDPAIVQRNPPRFSALCGLDDFFCRNTDTGPDFERMMAAVNAGYGSSDMPPALQKAGEAVD
jgi:ectoine hydroxylase-related dioxygenase (phytanoyl-CoA dioxygenase family)